MRKPNPKFRRVLILVLAMLMIFTIVACNSKDNEDPDTTKTDSPSDKEIVIDPLEKYDEEITITWAN